jgi:dihydrofolate reductase
MGHAVVAGRLTHESIVERLGGPLPGRVTVVVTRSGRPDDDSARDREGDPVRRREEGPVRYRDDVAGALAEAAGAIKGSDEVFVIGGAQIYAQALPAVTTVHLTRIHAIVDGDTRMPEGWLDPFALDEQRACATGGATFETYRRR